MSLLALAGCGQSTNTESQESSALDESENEAENQEETEKESGEDVDSESESTEEDRVIGEVHDPNETATTYDGDVTAHYTTHINQQLLDEHQAIDDEILEAFEEESYTPESPLVIQDPYERAPLTARVLFETEEPMMVTVTVEGRDGDESTSLSHIFDEVETTHDLPILGLYPNYENTVYITTIDESGVEEEFELTMTTGELPEDLLDIEVVEANTELMGEGLTFTSPSLSYPTGIDHNGDVRWYSSHETSNNFKRIENGNFLMASKEYHREDYDHLLEMDMLGKAHQAIVVDTENILKSSPFHHDMIELPNENYLVLIHDGSDEYIEDEIAEIDRETGEVVHRINLKDVVPNEVYEEFDGHNSDVGDWAHINTVYLTEDEESILLSVRQQDAIMKLSYPEAEMEWIFAYPEDWHEELEDYVLDTDDESLKYHAGPHAVYEIPDMDDDPDTMDIMLFDNNTIYTRGDEDLHEEYSRGVHYRINEAEETVEEIWSYGEERGTDFFTRIVSDSDYLPESETVLINSGRTLDEEAEERYSIITEVTYEEESEVVFEAHIGPFDVDTYQQMYRAERLPLYPK